jgi:putative transposase
MYKKVLPSHRLFKRFEERIITGDVALVDVVRMGAQIMLQHAVELEMSAFLDREYYQNRPAVTAARGRRSGYENHTVLTGEGPIAVQLPQARDLPEGAEVFHSKILDAYASRTETIDELINRMYVTGMSTRDIETVFGEVLEGRGVSRSTVSKITERLNEDLAAFRQRDLSGENVLYLFLDATYLKFRVDSERKEPVLAAYGIREDGSKVFLHVGPGNGESHDNWLTFLREMTARSLKTPLLVISDGAPGLVRAVKEVFPMALRQRCQKHRMNNILGKAPREARQMLRDEIHKAFHAETYDQGLRIANEVIDRFGDRFPAAMECLAEDLEACLQCLKLPSDHHQRVRTTNLLERLFGENRRRVKVIPHFFAEKAGLKLVYAAMLAASKKWRGVKMNAFIEREICALWQEVFGQARDTTWAA